MWSDGAQDLERQEKAKVGGEDGKISGGAAQTGKNAPLPVGIGVVHGINQSTGGMMQRLVDVAETDHLITRPARALALASTLPREQCSLDWRRPRATS